MKQMHREWDHCVTRQAVAESLMAWIAQQAQFFTSPDVKVRGL